MKNIKTLIYYDNNKNCYIKYDLKLKKEINDSDMEQFGRFLYRMKLDSSLSSKKTIRNEKTTRNLIDEYKRIISSDTIDFSGLMDIYDIDLLEKNKTDSIKFNEVATAIHIGTFLSFFDVDSQIEFSDSEMSIISRYTMNASNFKDKSKIEKTKAALVSIKGNSIFMNILVQKMNQRQSERSRAFVK